MYYLYQLLLVVYMFEWCQVVCTILSAVVSCVHVRVVSGSVYYLYQLLLVVYMFEWCQVVCTILSAVVSCVHVRVVSGSVYYSISYC